MPWPPRYFVAECTTTSAPHSIGRMRKGVATVLSTTSGTPCSWARAATASMSRISDFGLAIVSPKSSLVLGRIAARHESIEVGSSTKVTSRPKRVSVFFSRL